MLHQFRKHPQTLGVVGSRLAWWGSVPISRPQFNLLFVCMHGTWHTRLLLKLKIQKVIADSFGPGLVGYCCPCWSALLVSTRIQLLRWFGRIHAVFVASGHVHACRLECIAVSSSRNCIFLDLGRIASLATWLVTILRDRTGYSQWRSYFSHGRSRPLHIRRKKNDIGRRQWICPLRGLPISWKWVRDAHWRYGYSWCAPKKRGLPGSCCGITTIGILHIVQWRRPPSVKTQCFFVGSGFIFRGFKLQCWSCRYLVSIGRIDIASSRWHFSPESFHWRFMNQMQIRKWMRPRILVLIPAQISSMLDLWQQLAGSIWNRVKSGSKTIKSKRCGNSSNECTRCKSSQQQYAWIAQFCSHQVESQSPCKCLRKQSNHPHWHRPENWRLKDA